MREWIRHRNLFFGLSLIASLFGMVSDLCLLYIPGIRYEGAASPEVDYHFLLNLNPDYLWIGQTIGLFAIPFHFFGFLVVFPLLTEVTLLKKILISFLAALLLVYGIHYHGLILPTFWILKNDLDSTWISHSIKPLESIVVVIYVLISLILGNEILKKRTLYPKVGLWALPLVSYVFLLLLYVFKVPASNALMAMGLNLTFLLFFTYSFILSRSKIQ